MAIAEIFAFFRSLPEIVKILGQINDSLISLRKESIQRELDKIKSDFNTKLTVLIASKTDEERRKNLIDLYNALNR